MGAILGLADVFPDLCAEIYEAASAGDRTKAQTLAQKLVPPSKMLLMDYGIGGLKYAQDRLGFYGGLPRLPLLGVSDRARWKSRRCWRILSPSQRIIRSSDLRSLGARWEDVIHTICPNARGSSAIGAAKLALRFAL